MKIAAISQLKASLSEYLAGLKTGEEVIVTDRGRPVAKLVPFTHHEQIVSKRMLALERAGAVRIGKGTIPKKFWNQTRISDRKGIALNAILQERDEGR